MSRLESSLCLVTSQRAVAQSVAAAVDNAAEPTDVRRCVDLPTLAAQLERDPTPLALVDLDPDPDRVLTQLEPLVQRFANTRFVVTASTFTAATVVKAMNTGARHFLPRDRIDHDLPSVLQRYDGQSHASHHGRTITVLSAGGGCGATTLAVNLANELAHRAGEASLLIDFDNAYGSVATYLDLHGQYGIADILAHPDDVDPQLVTSTALAYSEQLNVLINPASIRFDDSRPMEHDGLDAALLSCRQAYRWVVVDAPRVSREMARDLARQSWLTFIVAQLSVKDIRIAGALHSVLTDQGISTQALRYLVSRYRPRRQPPTLEQARRAWNQAQVDLVRYDESAAIDAINLGQTLAQCAPRSAPCRDIQRLAATVQDATATRFQPSE